jgi:hypothetical protein
LRFSRLANSRRDDAPNVVKEGSKQGARTADRSPGLPSLPDATKSRVNKCDGGSR